MGQEYNEKLFSVHTSSILHDIYTLAMNSYMLPKHVHKFFGGAFNLTCHLQAKLWEG
jgi:hypothetical protein